MRHQFPCGDTRCEFCEHEAEARGWDLEPDYSTDGAADQYERYFDGPTAL